MSPASHAPSCDVLGIGLNATDTLLIVEEFPAYAGKVPFQKEMLSPGGQVATAIVACANLGLRAKYIGTLGDDLRGQIQRDSLQGTGVDISAVIVRKGCPNQTAYIIIDKRTGERTVLWQRSDCLRMTPAEIRPAEIVTARMLHIDGFDTEAGAFAASIARQHGIPVSIDVDTVYPGFESVLKNVDYLIAGSGWPRKWTGEPDPFKALTALQSEYGCRVVGMTMGHEGSLALEDGRWAYSGAFNVHCVDTTGAGDVFHGAFCYAVLRGMNLQETLTFSNAAAALNCTKVGARGHVPALGEVEALLLAATRGAVARHASAEILDRLAEISPAAQ